MENSTRLHRSSTDRVLVGVCGGLAEYFRTDPLFIRLLFIVFTFAGGSGVLVYLLLALLMPASGHPANKTQENIEDVAADMRESAERVAEEVKTRFKHTESSRRKNPVLALAIILVGLFLFFQVLMPNFYIPGKLVLAAVAIVFGIALLFRK